VSEAENKLELTGVQEGDALLIVVTGDVDLASAPDLVAAVDEFAGQGMTITLDLDDVGFVDLTGIRELARLREVARAGGWTLELAGITSRVRQVAELCGLTDALVYP
jgi:anti-sigma B factor antagonist